MKILFVIAHSGLARHLGRVIELAAIAGHEVAVIVGKEKKGLVTQTLQQIGTYLNIQQIKFVRPAYILKPILTLTRALLDIGLYFRADHPSPELVHRYGKIFPPAMLHVLMRPFWRRIISNKYLRRLLRVIEKWIPSSRAIRGLLKKHKPDIVVTTPYLFPGSDDIDYLKAAACLKIPTCSAVASWDNLSTKGTGHVAVDRLFVWNEALKSEAAVLHGINPANITITGSPTFDHLFKWAPSLSQEEFCVQAGAPADKILLLYLCSSGSIARDEEKVIRRFAADLSTCEKTRNCLLLVRPHPLNYQIWVNIEPLPENVCIYPKQGDLPDNPVSIDIYCHSIYFAKAMIGLNTSAFLEASVLDRSCIALPAMRDCYDQERFGHFRHLANGNFIHTPASLVEATNILSDMLMSGVDTKEAARRDFIKNFLRPNGMGREASAVMLDAILETARGPARAQAMRNYFNHVTPPIRDELNRSIVYVLIGLAHFPYHESVISALSRAGFRVHLAILKLGTASALEADLTDNPPLAELIDSFKQFLSEHPNIQVIEITKADLVTPNLSLIVRFLRSFASYIRRFPPNNFYRQRWLGYMENRLGWLSQQKVVHWLLGLPYAEQVLGWIDRRLRPNPAALAQLAKLKPDMVFVSPGNMRYNPEVEWLKAAGWLGIRTAIVTLSWDNLTTKGLIHIRPDHLFVWNNSHAEEARQIHHISDSEIFIAGAPFFDKWRHTERQRANRDDFLPTVGLDPARDYIVYLGSSVNIAENESWLIRDLYHAMKDSDEPALRGVQILVRPHPGNRKICKDLVDLPIVLSCDDTAGIPFSEARKQLLYNTLHHSVLVVSINTSAIIDAIAIGKPCISVKTEQYQDTHTKSAHFQHLLDAGAVIMVEGVQDCARKILEHLDGGDPSNSRRQDFVRRFIQSPLPEMTAGETIALIASRLLDGDSTTTMKDDIPTTSVKFAS